MKKQLVLISTMLLIIPFLNAQYSPVGNRIKTRWAETIDVNNVHGEYPRPLMERNQWQNLNGLWQYAITNKNSVKPDKYDGKILVPFAIESSLSGVGKTLGADEALWYCRDIVIPNNWKGKDILLNFGAVDWQADVWVNDIKVGSHSGGYTPFSINITDAIQKGQNKLVVKVLDPTDKSYIPRGKQVSVPKGIWYSSVSGIWQTVWMEPVEKTHIESIKILPDIDANILTVNLALSNNESVISEVKVYDNGALVASAKSANSQPLILNMPKDAKLWSPDSPFLYDMKVTVTEKGKIADIIDSYAAMRKYSMAKDSKGMMRLQLNNKNVFEFGPLDQGWWPDGLYTAPSYEALKYDIDKTKDFGFNMIRKHVKVEPAVWYTYCDKKGIIVWQDMPSGDFNRSREWQNKKYFDGIEYVRTPESEKNFRKEWKEIMDFLYSNPCVSTWVPFNEAWGQFKTQEIAEWTKSYDPSRIVNPASGGNFYHCGDMLDLHNYPAPDMYLFDPERINVVGEYGGIGYVVKDHLWTPDKNWGYIQLKSSKELTDEYEKYANILLDLVDKGVSGGVYTQTTDVEIEVNGIMTYDRKIVKMDEDRIRKINQKICNSLNK